MSGIETDLGRLNHGKARMSAEIVQLSSQTEAARSQVDGCKARLLEAENLFEELARKLDTLKRKFESADVRIADLSKDYVQKVGSELRASLPPTTPSPVYHLAG